MPSTKQAPTKIVASRGGPGPAATLKTERWSTDEFRGEKRGDTWVWNGHDPFEQRLDELRGSCEWADAAAYVRDTMITARAIAVSVYGMAWENRVLDIYDRLIRKMESKVLKAETSSEEET